MKNFRFSTEGFSLYPPGSFDLLEVFFFFFLFIKRCDMVKWAFKDHSGYFNSAEGRRETMREIKRLLQ